MKILVSEDSRVGQIFAKKILELLGHEAVIAENGIEAVSQYQDGDYDLILMDCMMPELDGYEATKQIRELEKAKGKHIPIIAMTANDLDYDKDKCIDAGMDDYILKPAKREELDEMLARYGNARST